MKNQYEINTLKELSDAIAGLPRAKRTRKSEYTFAGFLVLVGWSFVQAWVGMVALGMLAGYLGIAGLAIGFWATYVLFTLLSLAFSNEMAEALKRK